MAFLHPDYFPFCPKIGFDAPRAFRRADFQGPFSLEQAMALYWKVKTISISGTSFGPFDEPLPFSFTFSGPSKMSDVVCPSIEERGFKFWGWTDSQFRSVDDWDTIFFSSVLPLFGSSFQDNGNIVYAGGAYYVYFNLILFREEGSPVKSTSISTGTQTLDTTVNLQIGDLSVPIGFHIIDLNNPPDDPSFTSIISSFTCTTRDPS
jgi:hypothetical protein